MKFGLSESEYHYISETVVLPLKRMGVQVYCYGSRARGDFKKFSDLDLMIEGTATEALKSRRSDIEEQLSQGHFPYKVDLVFFDEFANSYRPGYELDKRPW